MRPFPHRSAVQQKSGAVAALIVVTMVAGLVLPRTIAAQTPPPRDTTRLPDSTRRVVVPAPPAGDSTKQPGVLQGVPGLEQLPFQINFRTEA